jgi:3-oxoadipate enol-lactonase
MSSPTVHLERAGEHGTPVLMLHGIGGAATSFAPQLAHLGGCFRAMAWDAPGYGASPDPDGPPGIAGYAATAARILETHGPGHVVGSSWGGVIACRLAAEHPALVRSLTLADSSRGSGRSAASAGRMRSRAVDLTILGAAEFARRRGPALLSPGADPALLGTVVAAMSAVRQPGYGYAAQAMAETDHEMLLAAITAPTLVVVGEHDRVTGVEESRRLAAGIAGARLAVIPGAGHAANQERPEEFNRLLDDFLTAVESHPRPGAPPHAAGPAGGGGTRS